VRLGLDLGKQGTSVQHAPDVQHKTKKASPPTFCMLVMIQIYLLQATTSDVMANIAGSFLFNAYACMRGEQSRNCDSVSLPHCKRRVALKGLKRCMVWLLVKKAPSSRTQCRVLLGSVSLVFKEGANGLTACFLPWVDSRGNEKSSACM